MLYYKVFVRNIRIASLLHTRKKGGEVTAYEPVHIPALHYRCQQKTPLGLKTRKYVLEMDRLSRHVVGVLRCCEEYVYGDRMEEIRAASRSQKAERTCWSHFGRLSRRMSVRDRCPQRTVYSPGPCDPRAASPCSQDPLFARTFHQYCQRWRQHVTH